MKNKGFTLVELLAIIVILAIIAVITVPIVLGIIDDAKKGIAIDSAHGYVRAINQFYLNNQMSDTEYFVPDGEYEISIYKDANLSVNGDEPSDGWVKVVDAEVTDFSFLFGDYVVNYNSSTDIIEAKKGRELALTPSMQIKEDAKALALEVVNNQSGTTGITDITEGWVAFTNGTLRAYSVKVTVSDKTFIVTDNDVYYVNNVITSNNAVANEGAIVAEKTNAQQLIVSYEVDLYVKAALTSNSSLTVETASTVAEMSSVTTNTPDSGWIHFNISNNNVVVQDFSLTYGTITANYSSFIDGYYVSSFGSLRNKPSIIVLGSEVCYGPEESQECFKIIKKDSTKVYLFSNYLLIKNNNIYKQDSSTSGLVFFSNTAYWIDKTVSPNILKSDYSNNGEFSFNPSTNRFVDLSGKEVYPYVYDSHCNQFAYVEGYLNLLRSAEYGLPTTISGRLLSYEEAVDKSIFANASALKNGKAFWLGSANSDAGIKEVSANGSITNYNNSSKYGGGVRPVIEVPLSDFTQ